MAVPTSSKEIKGINEHLVIKLMGCALVDLIGRAPVAALRRYSGFRRFTSACGRIVLRRDPYFPPRATPL
jgi:hypothetical protein